MAQAALFHRRFRPRCKLFRGRVAVVPLADIVLLLLLFLLTGFRFVLQPGFNVELPQAPFSEGAPYGPMVVVLTQEGIVLFNDERTTMEGLESAFGQAVHEHPDASIVVEADHRVQHGAIIRVLNMAAAAGVREVNLATRSLPPGGEAP
jgi:biopolymer transport protein ExbD